MICHQLNFLYQISFPFLYFVFHFPPGSTCIEDKLQPHTNEELCYKENTCETVLINSNFNCGFYINREALYDILRYKYNIQSIYDPCSYPGIQCKFYFNPDVDIQNGCQISQDNKELYKNVK